MDATACIFPLSDIFLYDLVYVFTTTGGAAQERSPLLSRPQVTCASGVQVYDEPTVLVCYRVTGEEEVPEGVVGVLTPDAPDVLSHLSVRARNMKVSLVMAPCANRWQRSVSTGAVSNMDAPVTWEGSPLVILGGVQQKMSLILQALFAICHDPDTLAEVAQLAGKVVAVDVTAAGGVAWHEVDAAGGAIAE